MDIPPNSELADPSDLAKYEKMRNDKILYAKVLLADLIAEIYKSLFSEPFTNVDELNSHYKDQSSNKPLLIIIPAIWAGGKDICPQFINYLDAGAQIWRKFTDQNSSVKIFLLGANHKGEGFLHQKGKKYLQDKYKIPSADFVGQENEFRDLGLCSVEEVELQRKFLGQQEGKGFASIITLISNSQFTRYFLIQKGYGIKSTYFILPDKASYFHWENKLYERYLIALTLIDPKWESSYGQKVRQYLHKLRHP